jgi:5-methyltetrahydrofolate--homocysteine methyltransferase
VVYVSNASRAVGVCQKLISKEHRAEFTESLALEYAKVREQHAKKRPRTKPVSLEVARQNHFKIDWQNYLPPIPNELGVQVVDVSLETLIAYIDWTPFFLTWSLAGKYPRILEDEVVGEEAKKLFADAKELLAQLVANKALTAKGIVGIFPAHSVQDDIYIYHDEQQNQLAGVSHHLRQQTEKPKGANYCLSDFVAPKTSGLNDFVGAFAVTAGIGEEALSKAYEKQGDDYNSIMIKAIADRLAEAFAEYLHEYVRKTLWGYGKSEKLSNEDLIREKYQGIRPAPGYAACPEHTEKQVIWDLLEVEKRCGISLTESYAMWPGASVSGWYFSHPNSRYFAVAQIQQDQLQDYAQRKNWTVEHAQKWLAPNIA